MPASEQVMTEGTASPTASPAGTDRATEPTAPRKRRHGGVTGIVVFAALGGLMLGVLGATLKVEGADQLAMDPSGPAPDFTLPLLRAAGLSSSRGRAVGPLWTTLLAAGA